MNRSDSPKPARVADAARILLNDLPWRRNVIQTAPPSITMLAVVNAARCVTATCATPIPLTPASNAAIAPTMLPARILVTISSGARPTTRHISVEGQCGGFGPSVGDELAQTIAGDGGLLTIPLGQLGGELVTEDVQLPKAFIHSGEVLVCKGKHFLTGRLARSRKRQNLPDLVQGEAQRLGFLDETEFLNSLLRVPTVSGGVLEPKNLDRLEQDPPRSRLQRIFRIWSGLLQDACRNARLILRVLGVAANVSIRGCPCLTLLGSCSSDSRCLHWCWRSDSATPERPARARLASIVLELHERHTRKRR